MSIRSTVERFGHLLRVVVHISNDCGAAGGAADVLETPPIILVIDQSYSMDLAMRDLNLALHDQCPAILRDARRDDKLTTIVFDDNASVIDKNTRFSTSGGTKFSSFIQMLTAVIRSSPDTFKGAHIVILTDGHSTDSPPLFAGSGKGRCLSHAGVDMLEPVRSMCETHGIAVHFIGLMENHDIHGLEAMMNFFDGSSIHSTYNYADTPEKIAANIGAICGEVVVLPTQDIEVCIGSHVHAAAIPLTGKRSVEFIVSDDALHGEAGGGAAAAAAVPSIAVRFPDNTDPDDESESALLVGCLPEYTVLQGAAGDCAEIEWMCQQESFDFDAALRKISAAIDAARREGDCIKKTVTRLYSLAAFVHSCKHESCVQRVKTTGSSAAMAAMELAQRRGAGRKRFQSKLAERLATGTTTSKTASAVAAARGKINWDDAVFPDMRCNFSLESFEDAVRDGDGFGICLSIDREIASPSGVSVVDPSQFPLRAITVSFQPIDGGTFNAMLDAVAAAGSLDVFGGDGHGLLSQFNSMLPMVGCEEAWPATEIVMKSCVGQIATGAPEGFSPGQLYTIPFLVLIRAAAAAKAVLGAKVSEHDAVYLDQMYMVCAHYTEPAAQLSEISEQLNSLRAGELHRSVCPGIEVFVGRLMTVVWMASRGRGGDLAKELAAKAKECASALYFECIRRMARLPHGERSANQVDKKLCEFMGIGVLVPPDMLEDMIHEAVFPEEDNDAGGDSAAAAAAAAGPPVDDEPADPILLLSKKIDAFRERPFTGVDKSMVRAVLARGDDVLSQIEVINGGQICSGARAGAFINVAVGKGIANSEGGEGTSLRKVVEIAAAPADALLTFYEDVISKLVRKTSSAACADAKVRISAAGNSRWYNKPVFPGLPKRPAGMSSGDYFWLASRALTTTFPSSASLRTRFFSLAEYIGAIGARTTAASISLEDRMYLDGLQVQGDLDKPDIVTESEQFWLMARAVTPTTISKHGLDYQQFLRDFGTMPRGIDTALKIWWITTSGFCGIGSPIRGLTQMADPYWHG